MPRMKKRSKSALIAALKPFAEYGVVYGNHYKADGGPWDQVPDDRIAVTGTFALHRITVGELRAASRTYWGEDGEPIKPRHIR